MTRFVDSHIRKAVIPVAGLGTRMLPVTKSIPKEMMPVCNKPIIQYAVEEAVASGLEEVILITRADKSILESYFSPAPELERFLQQHDRENELELVRSLSSLVRISAVQQSSPRGLGDALRCARSAIGDEPFAVILPDAMIDARPPVLAQLIGAYRHCPSCFVATQPVAPADTSRYGILKVASAGDDSLPQVFRVLSLVEKPAARAAPSLYGVFGRYLLQPRIFDYLDSAREDCNGELQLTEALNRYCQQAPLYALCFEGNHFDAGDRVGYLQVLLHYALKDPELGPALHDYLITQDLS
jgi:UTP--glucose-1-phosphate uridylyltransferase